MENLRSGDERIADGEAAVLSSRQLSLCAFHQRSSQVSTATTANSGFELASGKRAEYLRVVLMGSGDVEKVSVTREQSTWR